MSQSTSSNGGISLNDEAFFSVLLPDIENQIENEFQLPNLNALESFAQQFSASTKYLQLSTAQIALSTDNGAYTLLIQGSGMSIAGATLLGILDPGSIKLSSVNGTVTAAELYSGGSFKNGTVTGGTIIASATFSASQMTVSSGPMEVALNGVNLPNTAAAVQAIAAGTYSGPAISLSSIVITNDGTQIGSLTFGATSLTFVSNDYQLVIDGTFPVTLTSSLIDSLVGTGNLGLLNLSVSSAQLTRVSTGQVLLNVPYLTNAQFTSVNLQDIPGTIASIAAANAVGASVAVNTGTMQTPLDATLNGSTIEVAGTSGAAVLAFSGDSVITATNPSVDGQGVISSLIPGQTAVGVTVLQAAGTFVNSGQLLADGPAGGTFTIEVTQNATNGVTTQGGFTNDGTIRVDAGNSMVISIAAGAELFNAGLLIANGGSLFIDASAGALYAQTPGTAVIRGGGTIETNATGTASASGSTNTFLFADGITGDTLKIDTPTQFGGRIEGFGAGDTIDLGGSLALGQVVYNGGILDVESGGGTVLAALAIGDLSQPGTLRVNPATGIAGVLQFSTGADGDTVMTTTMSDVIAVTSGTLQELLDQTLNSAIVEVAGTGAAAVLSFTGDSAITHGNPSVDAGSLIDSLVSGQAAPGMTVLNAFGRFVNLGTILADGPAGSSFTLNVAQNGTAPGYFINDATIMADAGNTLTIAIAGTTALFNAGSIIANGGSVFIDTAANVIDAGYAGVSGEAIIEDGGTIETNIAVASSLGYFGPTYIFAGGVTGDTLKIDNVTQFDSAGHIRGFATGDTIDLGAALTVATIVYGSTLGAFDLLSLENAAGTILASLVLDGVHDYGTFAVTGGQADGFSFSTGADGDTLLTTAAAADVWNDASGPWQTGGDWSLGSAPGTLDTTEIGFDSASAFTLTTGSSPLTTAGFLLDDSNALVRITSATSVTAASGASSTVPDSIGMLGGTLEVTNGNTLTAGYLVQYGTGAQLSLDPGSVLDVAGALNYSISINGTVTIQAGNSIGVRIAGSALINGATLDAGTSQTTPGADGGSFYIGYGYAGAPAQVTVENGGVVSATFTELGSDPTSFGELTLTGPGTTWTDELDPRDTGNSRGYMTVGFNGYAASTPAGVAQSPYAGAAVLTVENGATLNDTRAYVGDSIDSAGSVTVSSGGQWNIGTNAGGFLVLSAGGAASLAVTNGGTVNVGGGEQHYLSGGTTVTNFGGIFVGYTLGTAGTITVSGANSLLEDSSTMFLGLFSQGILNVLNGGSVQAGDGITIGSSTNASGTILVSDPGSNLLAFNSLTVGASGSGMLTVRNGGSVQTYGDLILGGGAFSRSGTATGTVAVDNGGFLQASGAFLWTGSTLSVDATSGVDVGYSGADAAGAITIDQYDTLGGDGLIAASVVDNGAILATNNLSSSSGGELEITGSVSGTGSMTIASGATLRIDGALGSGLSIMFSAGAPETLMLPATAGPVPNVILGFAQGDTIEFSNNATQTFPTLTTLVNFNGTDGSEPVGGLLADSLGDLYATTFFGGQAQGGVGTVSEIVRSGTTYAATPKVLANFVNSLPGPNTGLIADASGDLFGALSQGGAFSDGAVFEISKTGTGYASTPTVLASFNSTDGSRPNGLVADAAGDLFGTTQGGGKNSDGTVFEIARTGTSYASAPATLIAFAGGDGSSPAGALIADAAGDLFGVTQSGGQYNEGTVFEVVNTATGYASTPTTLFSFDYSDGADPTSGLVADAAGNLFGTTFQGGTSGDGTVYEILNTSTGYASTPTTLVSFNTTTGFFPSGGVIVDSAGNLFGTTEAGGSNDDGTVFRVSKTAAGYANTAATLVSFNGTNGDSAQGGLIADLAGNLFGTTSSGGANSDGTVFELTNSGFIGAVTMQGTTITDAPASGQVVSLDQVVANPSIVPTGTIQSLVLDGAGTTTVGGTVTIINLEVGSGDLSLAGGTVQTDPVTVDAQGNISGYGTVTGAVTNIGTITANGGTLELTGSVTGIGTLLVDPGAAMQLDQGSSSGAVTVDAGALTAEGELDAGQSGLGGLLVESQATVTVGTTAINSAQGLDIAKTSGGSGDAVVSGTKSLLSNTGEFVVGDGGLGGLSIQGGGTVITTPGTVAGIAGAVIANTTGASGSSVNVSGAGSNWQVGGLLDVGVAGSGVLELSNGATVTTGSLDAANSAAAIGQISVSGSGSELSVTNAATVADDGTGVLSVLSGATFSAQSLTIGSQTDSSGALVVSGNGSLLSISGQLNIGTALGTGDLTVGPGAVVNAAVVNLQGGVVLEGGLLDPTVYIENGGSTTGGFGTIASDFILLEGTILSNGGKAGKQTEVVQGTLVGGGTADIKGSVSVNGPGILQIGTHDTIELTGAVLNAATTTFTDNLTPTGTYSVNNSVIDVVFQDSTGVLQLDDIAGFAGTVATWKAGDSFVITGGTLSNLGVANGDTLTVTDSGTAAGNGGIDSIIFAAAITPGSFTVVNGDTVQAVACFAEGTRIGTSRGAVAVEDLAVGDIVLTVDGHEEPIVWIGQRAVNCDRHPRPETVWPVRVRAGAFGENVPMRDLYLSPDHAVFVNDVLVPVKLLIDGTRVTQVKRDRVRYFHVELPRHEVILAEGLTVESYLELGDRANFNQHGHGETIRLFPDFAARLAPDTALAWETRGAAPLVVSGRPVKSMTMTFARRLAHVDNIQQQDSAERAFNKLARTFAVQMEALKRYRTGGEQKVTVHHVTVNEGGQAIVGAVTQTPGGTGGAGNREAAP